MHKVWGQAVQSQSTSCVCSSALVHMDLPGFVGGCVHTADFPRTVRSLYSFFSTRFLAVITDGFGYFSTLSTGLIITTTNYLYT